MGIRICDILENDYFREFKVIAGYGGLDRQFQGFAFMDAPDGFKWMRRREFVITSGYALSKEMDSMEQFMHMPQFADMAAFALKLRHIKEVPQKYIDYFNQHHIPLIIIPDSVAWMEMMNQVQVMVMNRNIQKFRVNALDTNLLSEAAYPFRKIERILKAAETEMKFPAFLYDVSTQKEYYSSSRFKKEYPYPFRAEDFWQPSFSYSKELMCPSLQMARYRFNDTRDEYLIPFSWITVPINVGESTKAYFVLMESREQIDYFDEFTIRIAVLLLQAVYEQITATQSITDQGFESFVTYAIQKNTPERAQLLQQASALNIKVQKKYHYALIYQMDPAVNFAGYREELRNTVRKVFTEQEYHFAFLDDNHCLLILSAKEGHEKEKATEEMRRDLLRFSTQLELEVPAGRFGYSMYEESAQLLEVKRCMERCKRAMELGPMLYPGEKIWCYQNMGAFAWLNIPQDEVESMFREYLPMLQDEKNAEMVRTLKIYLESSMNYSLTAEKMYVHINTVRKRIDRAEQIFCIDWDDHMARMKIELMLHLLKF
ncbi:MAG: PucR family transcriptional regulator [Anaerotignum sp.]|nr:PucR family transcriptional regulator [Anaerotignum sp.]